MSALSIQPTYPIFTDIDGQPLEDGFVWIGQANLDPQVNPINVFWDTGLVIPASQPIRTLGGYPSNSGTPARLYVNNNSYSIRVMNKKGSVVYSAPTTTERYNEGVVSTVTAHQVVYDPAGAGAVATTVQDVLRKTVSVKDFGAIGEGNQALYPTNYQTDIGGSSMTTITQQTADGIAINKAIVHLRSIGGGALYFPKGVYRTWAYLEPIDFPCRIYGDGIDLSIVKNCDMSPTNTNSYGIFNCGGTTPISIEFMDMTLDGNATVRAKPTSEFRSYPIAFYGKVNGKVTRIKSINSPIDCFYTSYENAVTSSMQVSDCTLDNSFRNTVALVAGWNQTFVNCSISGGGQVQGGTNPRYCLDIEPNLGTLPIKKLAFSNCHFFNAVNVIAGGVWCEALFSNCTFDAYGSNVVGYPWAFNFGQCQVELTGCKINGKDGELRGQAVHYYSKTAGGAYETDQYLKIVGCSFYGCGFKGIGVRSLLKDCLFMNSRYPVIYESASTGRHEISVENVTLINVIDVFNVGAGTTSSFAVKNTTEGPVIIDGLNIVVDPDSLPSTPSFSTGYAYGIYLSATGLSSAEIKASNLHMSGFYQKYPVATGQALNASNFRDWGSPTLPPANTAGQTAGPGAIYYANCTMYGNNP